jgi:nucleoside-diphosphate-sugar epimerase
MKSCIILGAGGFIGSAILSEAMSRGFDVIKVYRDNYEKMKGAKAEILINAAGNSRKFIDENDPASGFDLSIYSTMRSLVDFRFDIYILLSSGAIYPDEHDPSKNSETTHLDPSKLSRYGFHKWMAEQLVRHYARNRIILRLGGFVGPGLKKNAIFDLLKGKKLFVHPDSEFQYMDTRELAKALFSLAETENKGETLLNLSADGTISVRQAAKLAGVELSGSSFQLPLVRAELNLSRAASFMDLPSTEKTVSKFIEEVAKGEITLR